MFHLGGLDSYRILKVFLRQAFEHGLIDHQLSRRLVSYCEAGKTSSMKLAWIKLILRLHPRSSEQIYVDRATGTSMGEIQVSPWIRTCLLIQVRCRAGGLFLEVVYSLVEMGIKVRWTHTDIRRPYPNTYVAEAKLVVARVLAKMAWLL